MRILTTDRYDRWMAGLRDRAARARIARHFDRIQQTGVLTGDLKPVGDGVTEVRFHYGPGYRVYLTERGGELVILLAGGDKSSQSRDIAEAKRLAKEVFDGGHA